MFHPDVCKLVLLFLSSNDVRKMGLTDVPTNEYNKYLERSGTYVGILGILLVKFIFYDFSINLLRRAEYSVFSKVNSCVGQFSQSVINLIDAI